MLANVASSQGFGDTPDRRRLARTPSFPSGPSAKEMQVCLGAAIRRRRRALDITLLDLASACDVTFQQVQKYESGACAVSAAQLWNIACALDVPVSQFYDTVARAFRESRAEAAQTDAA